MNIKDDLTHNKFDPNHTFMHLTTQHVFTWKTPLYNIKVNCSPAKMSSIAALQKCRQSNCLLETFYRPRRANLKHKGPSK